MSIDTVRVRALLSIGALSLLLAGCGGAGPSSGAPAQEGASGESLATAAGGSTTPVSVTGAGQTVRAPVSYSVDGTAPTSSTVRILLNHAPTKARLQSLLASNAATATRFKAMVDAELAGGSAYAFEPWFAAMLYQLTGNASYCQFAIQRTDAYVASEEALIAANQRADVAFDSYLEVGPVIGNLALVHDWCRPFTTPTQRSRWIAYGNQAVSNVWNPTGAKWGNTTYPWSGWSINNPSNNYFYSFVEATMLLGLATQGENPLAPTWMSRARIDKLENQLFPIFDRDLQGGGSREGTGYGTSMMRLFRLYDWWEKSTGERIADRTQHTLASVRHMIHSITPTLDRLAPTGDHARDSSASLYDYHRDYLQVLMRLYPGEAVSGVTKSLLAASSVPRMSSSFMFYSDFLYDQSDIAARPLTDLGTAYHGRGTGQIYTRSSWSRDATYVNLICGQYDESHAHRDQGSFVLFRDIWLAYDQNLNSRSGIAGGESMHNLVRIEQNGSIVTQVESAPACNVLALADNAAYTYASMDVTPVYNGKAAVRRVSREVVFLKPGTLVVLDRVQTSGAGTRRVWTLNLPATPTVSGDLLSMTSGSSRLDVARLAPTGLATQVVSWPSADSDMTAGSRVDVADSSGDTSVFLHVLGTNGSVSSAVRSDAAGQVGAQVTLAGGGTALLRFSSDGTGGTIEIRNGSGSVVASGPLPTSVQSLP